MHFVLNENDKTYTNSCKSTSGFSRRHRVANITSLLFSIYILLHSFHSVSIGVPIRKVRRYKKCNAWFYPLLIGISYKNKRHQCVLETFWKDKISRALVWNSIWLHRTIVARGQSATEDRTGDCDADPCRPALRQRKANRI